MKISYNASAMRAVNILNGNDNKLSKSTEKLSSGYQINRAKDNPSGYALSRKMRAQLAGLKQATDSMDNGVSVLKTADGALNEVQSMLQRINELCVQGANGTMSTSDREALDKEVQELKDEIDRVSETTEFNGQKILNGTFDLRGYTDNLEVKVLTYDPHVEAGSYTVVLTATAEAATDEAEVTTVETTDDDGNTTTVTTTVVGGVTYTQTQVTDSDGNITTDTTAEVTKLTYDISSLTDEDGNALLNPKISKQVGNRLTITADDGFSLTIWLSDTYQNTMLAKVDKAYETAYDTAYDDAASANEVLTTEDLEALTATYTVTGEDNMGFTADLTGIGAMTVQAGANEGQTLDAIIPSVDTRTLGVQELDVLTEDTATKGIDYVSDALVQLSELRARIGAYQNRLESASRSGDNTVENMTSALSTITDVDMSEEYTTYSTYNVLVQATTSVLAQANERPSQVLQLLQ